MTGRQQKLLELLDVERQRGIEIGPLDRPVVARHRAMISYADRYSTDELKVRHAADAAVESDKIVRVDHVCGDRSLRETLGAEARLDFVIASHVLQEVPDLIAFLGDLASLLRPDGIVALAIPDQRYGAAYFRRPTGLADLVATLLQGVSRPSIAQLFDHFADHRPVPLDAAWNGTLHREALPRTFPLAEALRLARSAASSEPPVGCTAHAFTPASFSNLLYGLAELELLRFTLEKLWPTAAGESEFIAILRRTADVPPAVRPFDAIPLSAAVSGGPPAVAPRAASRRGFLATSVSGGFEHRVFYVTPGVRFWVPDPEWATTAGFRWPEDLRRLSDEELSAYRFTATPVPDAAAVRELRS